MKLVASRDAVGTVLCHDITEIVPGRFKGPAFRRGHIVRKEDVEKLLDLGKEHVAVLELKDGWVHEDDAALRLAAAASGEGIALAGPSEGRVNLVAAADGLLKINVDALHAVNSLEGVMLATLHTDRLVKCGQKVAGTRVIPLVIEGAVLGRAESLCGAGEPVVSIKEVLPRAIGIVTTGSEVYHGRIEDRFGPVIIGKIASLGSRVLRQVFVSDDVDMTVRAIKELMEEGAEFVMVTGGMSVDPDDLTPASIRATGAEVVTYGAPLLPGAMFMLAYLGDTPVIGLPGCVMYHQASIFDLVVPRLLAGERLTREDFVPFGHGGLCAGCESCRFPTCGFGA